MRDQLTRRGFSVVELVVVLVIAGAAATAIASVLHRQQRFFTNAAFLVEQRVSLRDATGILPAELRALSPANGDVIAFSDSALDMRATIGIAVACDTVPGGGALDLAPSGATSMHRYAAYTAAPQAGDVALVFDAGPTTGADDDRWLEAEVAGAAPAANGCAASPLADHTSDADPALRLRFTGSGSLSPTVRPGAFVRILRRVRYGFYRAGSGDWFLGYSEWGGAGFGTVQPVSGPFAPYAAGGRGGFALRYFDAAGAALAPSANASRIRRVEITARGLSGRGLSEGRRSPADSQTIVVRPRND